jgi:hypothetical protein
MQKENKNRAGRYAEQFDEYRKWALLAQEQTGKSWRTQLREILSLKHMGGQCGISDYYWYKLYDDSYQMGRGAQDFLGWRLQQGLSLALNPRHVVLPAWDKFIFTLIAHASGLPVVPIRACYHRAKNVSEGFGLHLRSQSAAGEFLRDAAIYPLFSKPAYSQQGYGTSYFTSYDASSDSLCLLDDTTISMDSFLRTLDEAVDPRYHKPECGHLFQDPCTLAPEIKAITNWSAICGVRVMCLNGPDGVKPIRGLWKVAVPPNHVDNFHGGEYGNMVADVDVETGEVSRLLNGMWPQTEVLLHHPISGAAINGFHLPGWSEILEACRQGGAVFPLMKIQHWDFALTDQGPLMLELNDLGGTEGMQLHGRGILTEETRIFIKRYANHQAHSWVSAL